MKALSQNFSDYAIYATSEADILIVASASGTVPDPDPSFLTMRDLTMELRRVDIMGPQDISVRMLGNKALFAPFFESYAITTNSDYAPVVDLYAVRSRYYHRESVSMFHNSGLERLPIVEMLGNQRTNSTEAQVTYSGNLKSQNIHMSAMMYQYLMLEQWKWNHPYIPRLDEILQGGIIARQVLTRECSDGLLNHVWWNVMLNTIAGIESYLSQEQFTRLLHTIETASCARRLSSAQRDFISLLKAVGKKDPALMAQYSKILLAKMENRKVDADLLEYVLSAGMLGYLSSGNNQDAGILWRKYSPLLPDKNVQSMPVRLLVSHLSWRQPNLSELRRLSIKQ
jgi:spermidine synthase